MIAWNKSDACKTWTKTTPLVCIAGAGHNLHFQVKPHFVVLWVSIIRSHGQELTCSWSPTLDSFCSNCTLSVLGLLGLMVFSLSSLFMSVMIWTKNLKAIPHLPDSNSYMTLCIALFDYFSFLEASHLVYGYSLQILV